MEKIKFALEPENGFYITLKKRVHAHFKENNISRYSNMEVKIKSALFISLFMVCYVLIVTTAMPVALFYLHGL